MWINLGANLCFSRKKWTNIGHSVDYSGSFKEKTGFSGHLWDPDSWFFFEGAPLFSGHL